MPILLRLRELAPEQISFGFSPAQECVHALHVLADATHHPLHIEWILRTRRRMSPQLKREVDYFRSLVEELPLLLMWEVRRPADLLSFEQELAGLRSVPAPQVAAFLLTKADGPLKEALQADPEGTVLRFIAFLERFWQECMVDDWPDLEERLAADIAARGRALWRYGLAGALANLSPDTHLDPDAATLTIRRATSAEVVFGAGHELRLAPSYFSWPHVLVQTRLPCVIITYPIADQQAEGRAPLPPEKVLRLLRAAGDLTRLQMLQLIAQRPRTTRELAGVIGVSEAAVSRHLKQLQDAGCVAAERQSYYVFYRLRRAALRDLASGLERLLTPEG